MVFIFEANDFDGELNETREGTLKWIDDSKIPNLDLPGVDKEYLIKWLAKGEFFSAKFIYEGGKLIDHKVSFYK